MPSEYRRGRGPLFAAVPVDLMEDPECDAMTIAVYAALKSFADFGSEHGAQVGDNRASERAGVSPRTLRRRRDRLREMGWIEWETVNTLFGWVNRYTIHSTPPAKGAQRSA